jgi:hypothetical protein
MEANINAKTCQFPAPTSATSTYLPTSLQHGVYVHDKKHSAFCILHDGQAPAHPQATFPACTTRWWMYLYSFLSPFLGFFCLVFGMSRDDGVCLGLGLGLRLGLVRQDRSIWLRGRRWGLDVCMTRYRLEVSIGIYLLIHFSSRIGIEWNEWHNIWPFLSFSLLLDKHGSLVHLDFFPRKTFVCVFSEHGDERSFMLSPITGVSSIHLFLFFPPNHHLRNLEVQLFSPFSSPPSPLIFLFEPPPPPLPFACHDFSVAFIQA